MASADAVSLLHVEGALTFVGCQEVANLRNERQADSRAYLSGAVGGRRTRSTPGKIEKRTVSRENAWVAFDQAEQRDRDRQGVDELLLGSGARRIEKLLQGDREHRSGLGGTAIDGLRRLFVMGFCRPHGGSALTAQG